MLLRPDKSLGWSEVVAQSAVVPHAKMTRLLIISALILLTSNFLLGQDKYSLVKDIRLKYTEIRTNLNSYDTTMVEIWDESTEGGQATAYYDNGNLKLIEVVWLSETGKNQIEYYFNDGKLIFAFDQDLDYNRPIYWNEEIAKENGDNEVFDPEKTTVKEDRYYFNNEQLFLWLNNDKQEQDLTMGTNSIVGQGLVAHCYKMKEELEN
jgi:hypothetical protein